MNRSGHDFATVHGLQQAGMHRWALGYDFLSAAESVYISAPVSFPLIVRPAAGSSAGWRGGYYQIYY